MPPKEFYTESHVPIIETTRLKLREHRPNDLSECAAMWHDPVVTRHIGGKPFNRQQTWSKILNYAGLWALTGFGYWLVEEKTESRFVGEIGFADFKREVLPDISNLPELGWALSSKEHGKGYATEALQAVLKWGDANLGSRQTACLIDPGNQASLRVAAKIGYKEFQRTTYQGLPTIIFIRESESS